MRNNHSNLKGDLSLHLKDLNETHVSHITKDSDEKLQRVI
jgi:hypothetical protein